MSKVGLDRDIYEVMTMRFCKVRGWIGMTAVGANAAFAAVIGSSIASASVFTKVSVPQMIAQDYNPYFTVGVVAASSVLGMIIPPCAMLIIFSFVAEQSVGDMGGIYTGWMTAVEAGATRSLVALLIALGRRAMSPKGFWELLETGHITAAIVFLITAASIYSRMLGLPGLPNQLQDLKFATDPPERLSSLQTCVAPCKTEATGMRHRSV